MKISNPSLITNLLNAALIIMTIGCSPSSNGPAGKPVEARPTRSLVDIVSDLQQKDTGSNPDACDEMYGATKLKLARILDAKEADLKVWFENQPTNSDKFELTQVGPLPLFRNKHFKVGPEGWANEPMSWQGALDLYESIENQPLSWKWDELNAQVRSLLHDDESRILDWYNRDLSHGDEPLLRKLTSEVQACLDDSTCLSPHFSPTSVAYFNQMPLYTTYFSPLLRGGDRKLLETFSQRLQSDITFFEFHHNDSISRSGPTELTLPLAADINDESKVEIESFIHSVWNVDDALKVNIRWVDSPSPDLASTYHFIFENLLGERSFVLWSKKEIHLFPYIHTSTIAHEIGHVLGFPDHYFTHFQRTTCGYNFETNYADVMSDSASGIATAEELALLLQQYPPTK